MTPEEMAMIQQQQQQQAPAQEQFQAPAQEQFQAPAQEQQPAAPSPEEIKAAKEALGLTEIEDKLRETEKQAINKELATEYADVPQDKVEEELERIAKTDPNLANAMRMNKESMRTLYQALNANIEPAETPDEILDSGDNDADNGIADVKARLDKGEKVSDVELGDYILSGL